MSKLVASAPAREPRSQSRAGSPEDVHPRSKCLHHEACEGTQGSAEPLHAALRSLRQRVPDLFAAHAAEGAGSITSRRRRTRELLAGCRLPVPTACRSCAGNTFIRVRLRGRAPCADPPSAFRSEEPSRRAAGAGMRDSEQCAVGGEQGSERDQDLAATSGIPARAARSGPRIVRNRPKAAT